jgi:hypothetical protein
VIIISGGQTGVDRGALDAALACGIDCGGWCPADRLAEDGTIPDRYPLRPVERPGYSERTLRNVLDSDGTLILYSGSLVGGTEETLLRCLQLARPYRLVDGREVRADRASELAAEFVSMHDVSVLNVAGPRASEWRGAHDYAYEVVSRLCERVAGGRNPAT